MADCRLLNQKGFSQKQIFYFHFFARIFIKTHILLPFYFLLSKKKKKNRDHCKKTIIKPKTHRLIKTASSFTKISLQPLGSLSLSPLNSSLHRATFFPIFPNYFPFFISVSSDSLAISSPQGKQLLSQIISAFILFFEFQSFFYFDFWVFHIFSAAGYSLQGFTSSQNPTSRLNYGRPVIGRHTHNVHRVVAF